MREPAGHPRRRPVHGAEGIKIAEEANVFGGLADVAARATIALAQSNPMAGGPRGRAKFDVKAFPKPKPQAASRP